MAKNSLANWLTPQFRIYVWQAISKTREIKCEKCGTRKNIEMHHKKYAPKENVSINDIQLLCNKCHRNSNDPLSQVSTVLKNGKRFCIGSNFQFHY